MKSYEKNTHTNTTTTKHLVAQFTKRDLILYALGIGCCDGTLSDEKELQYIYENHIKFQPFPTFLLALSFVAQSPSNQSFGYGVKPFPPESMSNRLPDGSKCDCIIPCDFFKNIEDMKEVQNNPTLNISQSLTLHEDIILKGDVAAIDPPTQVQLQTRVISVIPRAIGTFVSTQTTYHQGTTCIATAQMVALVLGVDPDMILPFNQKQVGDSRMSKNKLVSDTSSSEKIGKSEVILSIPNNAALLYRLSGDYNSIHVEGDILLASDKDTGGPILHGLCTLGYAVRAVLYHIHQQHLTTDNIEVKVISVKCNFTKPVFKSVFKKDSIHVEVWSNNKIIGERPSINFRVYRMNDDIKNVVVDKGRLQYRMERSRQASTSRL